VPGRWPLLAGYRIGRSPSSRVAGRPILALLKQLILTLIIESFLLLVLLMEERDLLTCRVEPINVVVPLVEEVDHPTLWVLIDSPTGGFCPSWSTVVQYTLHREDSCLRCRNELLNVSFPVFTSSAQMILILNVSRRAAQAVASASSRLWSSVVQAEGLIWLLLATWRTLPLLELVA
jgi:hypothetical protein